jgi:peptidoglycan/LPS O-acetylase OafA/YrhL
VLVIVHPGADLSWCVTYLSNFYFAVNTAHSPMEHTWSLAVEEHFYLVWPFAVYALSVTASRRVALFGMIPAAIALAVATAFFEERLPVEADAIIYRVTFYRMISLALGAVIAYTEPQLRREPVRTVTLMGALFLPAILTIAMSPLVDHRWVGPVMLVGFSLLSGSILLAAIAADRAGNLLAKLLGWSPLTYCGRISYGLYLYHLPVFTALGVWGFPKGEPPPAWISGSALLLSAGVATASFYWIEQPLMQRSATWLKGRTPGDRRTPPEIDDPTGTHRVPAI